MKINGYRLIVWHGEKHDEFTTTEVLLKTSESGNDWVRATQRAGGFWYEGDAFVPWHKINYIKLEM